MMGEGLLVLLGFGVLGMLMGSSDSSDTPETEEPETEEPVVEDPGTVDPIDPEPEDPGTEDPEPDVPDTEEPETDDPATDEPESEEPDVPETEEPEDTVNFLNWTGEATITGTEGDDALLPIDDTELMSRTTLVDLLGGDDVAEIVTDSGTTVLGGAGDDTLTSTNANNTLDGGADNDTLIGVAGNTLLGGDGDDDVTLDQTALDSDTPSVVDGGDGDDQLTLIVGAGNEAQSAGGGFAAAGGSGADTFDVIVDVSEFADTSNPADGIIDNGQLLQVDDFVRNEDVLLVQLADTSVNSNAEITDVEVIPYAENFSTEGADIILTITDPDSATTTTAFLRVVGVQNLLVSDIVIVA